LNAKHDFQEVPIPIPATDSLTSAMKNNIVPNQEYLLQGSVLDSAVEVLLHRLRGLCDNVDSGPETFHDHEMCFSISNNHSRFSSIYRSVLMLLLYTVIVSFFYFSRKRNPTAAHIESKKSNRLSGHAVPAALHRTTRNG